ncbi:MAG: hypothetical protein IJZ06_05535 [Bacteroidales bacterium]|nr:hypothetical protein [Bacteroidales bacterium]
MKKIIITIILAVGLGRCLIAQNDGFFVSNYSEYRGTEEWGNLPNLPGSHGFEYDYAAAPVGGGLLLLGGMAILYAKRKKN